jgi:ferredoxin
MLTAKQVKKRARALGADLVGIGNIERWAGAPLQMDPKQIMPECRSVIVCGFRVHRGTLRGIEEGTMFSNYAAMGYGGITYLRMPPVMWGLADLLEDDGCEAAPIGQIDWWRSFDDAGSVWQGFSRPVAPGKAAPDVSVHTRIAAYLAGLGEFGWSKVFLTPQFGPRQRFGIVLTEAELEPDPLYAGPPLCNRCLACVRDCPAQAISGDLAHPVTVELAGRTVSWGEFDAVRCCNCFSGGEIPEDQGAIRDEDVYSQWLGLKSVRGRHTPFYKKGAPVYWTGQAICGGRGCVRACMMSLEARGAIGNRFRQSFRRRPRWSVDWAQEPPPAQPPAIPNRFGARPAAPEAKPTEDVS